MTTQFHFLQTLERTIISMITVKNDIATETDIKIMVDSFYQKVNKDLTLSPYFNEMAKVNWEKHLPVMYTFWSSILFGSMSYHGNPFPKHRELPLKKEDFDRWINLFLETVDENFKGLKAEEAKTRATQIANTFLYKLNLLK